MDLSEQDESDGSSSYRSRSAKHVTNDGQQEERSGPSENRFNRMERILEGMLTHVTRNEPPRAYNSCVGSVSPTETPGVQGKNRRRPLHGGILDGANREAAPTFAMQR